MFNPLQQPYLMGGLKKPEGSLWTVCRTVHANLSFWSHSLLLSNSVYILASHLAFGKPINTVERERKEARIRSKNIYLHELPELNYQTSLWYSGKEYMIVY